METERVSSAVASIARTVLVRLAPGEDLFCGLRTVCERHGLRSGRIATMIGSLRTASLVCVTPDPANPGRVVYLEPRTVEGPLELIAALLLGISENPLVILLMINIILLFAGMLLDAISIAYVFLPILAPVIVTFGWDDEKQELSIHLHAQVAGEDLRPLAGHLADTGKNRILATAEIVIDVFDEAELRRSFDEETGFVLFKIFPKQ